MDIERDLEAFIEVCNLANINLTKNDIQVITLEKSHKGLTTLKKEEMAVYIFVKDSRCYKVGKAGPKSNNRYMYHHYDPKKSNSNLAKSILNDKICDFNIEKEKIGDWIKQNMLRINLVMNIQKGILTLNLLEAFLHCRLKPIYEGFESQSFNLDVLPEL